MSLIPTQTLDALRRARVDARAEHEAEYRLLIQKAATGAIEAAEISRLYAISERLGFDDSEVDADLGAVRTVADLQRTIDTQRPRAELSDALIGADANCKLVKEEAARAIQAADNRYRRASGDLMNRDRAIESAQRQQQAIRADSPRAFAGEHASI